MQMLKVVLVGNAGAGKTSLISNLLGYPFKTEYQETVGVDFHVKTVTDNIRLQFWDTAGGDRFQNLLPVYTRGAHAYIIVVDLTETNALDNFDKRVKSAPEGVKPIVVISKSDLPESLRKVSLEDLKQRCEAKGIQDVVETSAKTGAGVEKLIGAIIKSAPENQLQDNIKQNNNETPNIKLSPEEQLKSDLQKYIDRFKHGDSPAIFTPNKDKNVPKKLRNEFRFGFNLFCQGTQEINRIHNYHLAVKMKGELDRGDTVETVLNTNIGKRFGNGLFGFADKVTSTNKQTNINSTQLNEAISTARKSLKRK